MSIPRYIKPTDHSWKRCKERVKVGDRELEYTRFGPGSGFGFGFSKFVLQSEWRQGVDFLIDSPLVLL